MDPSIWIRQILILPNSAILANALRKEMRLLLVANRLPVTIEIKDEQPFFKKAVGGVVSSVSSYLDCITSAPLVEEFIWVGWPGTTISDDRRKRSVRTQMAKRFYVPVFLTEELMDGFYNGFCNQTIWPILHGLSSYAVFNEEHWSCYKQANDIFCGAVAEVAGPNDVVWIHDYHLMLLPQLLRNKALGVPIGFFLHTPFPSFDFFDRLPNKWGKRILEGLLGADLLGFQTRSCIDNFMDCTSRILGYKSNSEMVFMDNRIVRVAALPASIDYSKYHNAVNTSEVIRHRNRLKERFVDAKLILFVSRLDYTKGITNALLGYEQFLEYNPQWHGKITLILIVSPSRLEITNYQQVRKQIDELVGRINGEFGSLYWEPIVYQFKSASFDLLAATYSICDVALVTPLSDGMNLIAKEYVATRRDGLGVLILSKFAGASEELTESLVVNPYNPEEIVAALSTALTMPEEEQKRRNHLMQKQLMQNSVLEWGNRFLQFMFDI